MFSHQSSLLSGQAHATCIAQPELGLLARLTFKIQSCTLYNISIIGVCLYGGKIQ